MKSTEKFHPSNRDLGTVFGTPLFAGIGEAECRRAFERINAYTVCYAPNETIVEAGDRFSEIGFLTEGEAAVIRSGERRRVIHKTLAAGDVFGVSSLFDAQSHFPTTVRAINSCTVVFLSEEDITTLLEEVSGFAKNYICLLTGKIRFLNHRLDSLAGRSAEERVAEHLLSEIGEGGTLGVTKSALASMLGLGRASLYRILDIFEEGGFIRTSRDRIEILDGAALKSFIKNRKEI